MVKSNESRTLYPLSLPSFILFGRLSPQIFPRTDESSGQDSRELSAADIDRSDMNYWLLRKRTTSPTDLATFASRTITWSALQTLLAESAIGDWFFFRDISRWRTFRTLESGFGSKRVWKVNRVNRSKNGEQCTKAWLIWSYNNSVAIIIEVAREW